MATRSWASKGETSSAVERGVEVEAVVFGRERRLRGFPGISGEHLQRRCLDDRFGLLRRLPNEPALTSGDPLDDLGEFLLWSRCAQERQAAIQILFVEAMGAH